MKMLLSKRMFMIGLLCVLCYVTAQQAANVGAANKAPIVAAKVMQKDYKEVYLTHKEESKYPDEAKLKKVDIKSVEKVHLSVRLVSNVKGSIHEGRVEHYNTKEQVWKPVCGDYWNKVNADVVCRQLGYELGAEKAYQKHTYGEGDAKKADDYTLPTLHCSGFEERIENCTKNEDIKCAGRSAGVKCLRQMGCPPNWTEFGGECFKVVNEKQNYVSAVKTCADLGASLARPSTSVQMSFLSRFLKDFNNVTSVPSAWIGVNLIEWKDKSISLGWQDVGKSVDEITTDNSHWMPVEDFKKNDKDKPCVGVKNFYKKDGIFHKLHSTEEYWWSDFGCGNKMAVICQRGGVKRTLSLSLNSQYNYECYLDKGEVYRGTYSKTVSNFTCMPWSKEQLKAEGSVEKVHNYCRNFDKKTKPWCFTDAARKNWEFCSLPECEESNSEKMPKNLKIDSYKIGFNKGGCDTGTFYCPLGANNFTCLNKFMVCDGYADCEMGEDEDKLYCGDDTCDAKDFLCPKDKYCIDKSKLCDGYEDCSDGSDESKCQLDKTLFEKTMHVFSTVASVTPFAIKQNVTKHQCVADCYSIAIYNKFKFDCEAVNYMKESKKALSQCRFLSSIPTKNEMITDADFDVYTLDRKYLNGFKCEKGMTIDRSLICNGVNNCGDGSDEVDCKGMKSDYKLRMVRKFDEEDVGRIEMRSLKDWGYICVEGFTMTSADVACKELGYEYAVRFMTNQEAGIPYGFDRSILTKVKCKGTEKFLKDCPASSVFGGICTKRQAVVVECSKKRECESNEFKCKNSGKCIHNSMICDLNDDCGDKSDENQDCSLKAVLEGGDSSSGRLVLIRGPTNGTVCADNFDDNAAKVACKMLGFEKRAKVITTSSIGPGRGLIALDKVKCTGNEATLLACSHNGWGKHTCSHRDDVIIDCKAKKDKKTEPVKEVKLPECGGRDNDLWFGSKLTLGGYVTDEGGFPWLARFVNKAKEQVCLGAIVSDRWILTAASCFDGVYDPKGNLDVIVGDLNSNEANKDRQFFSIAEIHQHGKYQDPKRYSNDMAMVRVKGNNETYITFNKNVKHVCIPEDEELPTTKCLIAGWSRKGNMEMGSTEAYEETKCEKFFDKMPAKTMCAASNGGLVDACKGDIGSPLICPDQKKFKLYGISSFINGCGLEGLPTIYSRPQFEKAWINDLLID